MKDRRMVELTLRCYRWSDRGNDKSSKKQGFGWEVGAWLHLLFISHRYSNWDNNLSKEKQGTEWVIKEWLSLLLTDEQWSKWVNNQAREKKGIQWKIAEWLNLLLNSSPMFQLRQRSIQRKRRDWTKNRSTWTYFSLLNDVSLKASIYPERNKRLNWTLKDDWAYFSALNYDPIQFRQQ